MKTETKTSLTTCNYCNNIYNNYDILNTQDKQVLDFLCEELEYRCKDEQQMNKELEHFIEANKNHILVCRDCLENYFSISDYE